MSASPSATAAALSAGTLPRTHDAASSAVVDPRATHAKPDVVRFLVLVGQLALLLALFDVYRTEEGGFFRMVALAFGGFAVHYWLPFAYKELWWITLSAGGSALLLGPLVATAAVFVATWAMHSYQWFWLRGDILFTWPDSLFWAILGALVIVNLLMEQNRPKRKAAASGFQLMLALKTAGTFSFIVVLWSLWNAPTVGEWFDILTWWKIG